MQTPPRLSSIPINEKMIENETFPNNINGDNSPKNVKFKFSKLEVENDNLVSRAPSFYSKKESIQIYISKASY